jgi:hypothetical protein
MLWTISVLGLALMLAPFVLGYAGDIVPQWTSIILGAVIALASGYKALAKDTEQWENWVAGIAGVLAVLAPYELGFNGVVAALWPNVILGAAVAILAEAEVSTRQPQTREHQHGGWRPSGGSSLSRRPRNSQTTEFTRTPKMKLNASPQGYRMARRLERALDEQ